ETEEYGISSFVYKTKSPFDPDRLWRYFQSQFPSTILRSKGLFWLASRPSQAMVWGQAGGSLNADSAGVWWSSMPLAKRNQFEAFTENQEEIDSTWHSIFGDRKTEIVIIGREMDEEGIRAKLNACLSTNEEIIAGRWEDGYEDDWPVDRAYAF
ncbi:MAG: GTP-binding protein, partial [Salibacteraceae bacterium]